MYKFFDFNHMFSNISYVTFGLSYMCFVWFKSTWINRNKNLDPERFQTASGPGVRSSHNKMGVLPLFGIDYALGFVLFSQGLFSLCYHVCPSNINLQFDTTPMCIICILGVAKLYQVNLSKMEHNQRSII